MTIAWLTSSNGGPPGPGSHGLGVTLARDDRWLLAAILSLAAVLRFTVIWTQPRVVHADETFQYLEQAHRLLFGAGVVPWEFADGARSWLLPGLAAGAIGPASWFSDNPLVHVLTVRVCAAILSLTPVYIGFRLGHRAAGTAGGVLTGAICAVWFELIYFAPLILTEVISTHVALWALWFIWPGDRPAARRLALAGALFALAVCLRVQSAPALLGAIVWINRGDRRRWGWLLAGGVPMAVLAGGILDWVTLGTPFQSIWLNITRNLWQGIGAANGLEARFYYLHRIWWFWGYAAIVGLFAAAGAIRLPALGIAAALTILVHGFIGHKEYRFIYLALASLPILAGVGISWLAMRWYVRPRHAVAVVPVIAAALSWYAATHDLMRQRWTTHRPYVRAFLDAHGRDDLCGLGVKGVLIFNTGGYTYLHRDVPLFFEDYAPVSHLPGVPVPLRTWIVWRHQRLDAFSGPIMQSNTKWFNYLLAPPGGALPGYEPAACFAYPDTPRSPEVCLYRRPGGCDPVLAGGP